jgi:hypothetical protein
LAQNVDASSRESSSGSGTRAATAAAPAASHIAGVVSAWRSSSGQNVRSRW